MQFRWWVLYVFIDCTKTLHSTQLYGWVLRAVVYFIKTLRNSMIGSVWCHRFYDDSMRLYGATDGLVHSFK